MTRKALGRGLSSLIPEVPPLAAPPVHSSAAAEAAPAAATPYVEIDLDRIDPNPVQPRSRFSEMELEELAASNSEWLIARSLSAFGLDPLDRRGVQVECGSQLR